MPGEELRAEVERLKVENVRLKIRIKNQRLLERLGVSEIRTEHVGSTERVIPEIIAEAGETVSKLLSIHKRWYGKLSFVEKSLVDPYWLGYEQPLPCKQEHLTVNRTKGRVVYWVGDKQALLCKGQYGFYSICDLFSAIAERHHLFTTASDGLIVPNDEGILRALFRDRLTYYALDFVGVTRTGLAPFGAFGQE